MWHPSNGIVQKAFRILTAKRVRQPHSLLRPATPPGYPRVEWPRPSSVARHTCRLHEGQERDRCRLAYFGGRKKNFNGEKLWARGYAVSTVGFEETQIRKYIENQQQLNGKGEDESGEF